MTHEPIDRPRRTVANRCSNSNSAGAWLNWSVCIDLMKHKSSATRAQVRQHVADPLCRTGRIAEMVRRAEQFGHALDEREPLAFEYFCGQSCLSSSTSSACNRTCRDAAASRPCADR